MAGELKLHRVGMMPSSRGYRAWCGRIVGESQVAERGATTCRLCKKKEPAHAKLWSGMANRRAEDSRHG